jgi:hypothetical protein
MQSLDALRGALIFKSLRPPWLAIVDGIGHHFAFDDPGLRVEELHRGRSTFLSGLDNNLGVPIDDFPLLNMRQLRSNQTDCHPPAKETHAGWFHANIEWGIAFSSRRGNHASHTGDEPCSQTDEECKPKVHGGKGWVFWKCVREWFYLIVPACETKYRHRKAASSFLEAA